MTTKTKNTTAIVGASNGTSVPAMPSTLEALQFLRTAKTATANQIYKNLDIAFVECKKNDMILLLERIMLHIGDISRQHNLLRELGIISKTGGAQERKIFRTCLNWWAKNLPESFAKNIHVFPEFTVYENFMYYQNTTDRVKGNVKETEVLFPNPTVVHEFLAHQIRKGKDLNLIAKHLPKYSTGSARVAKKVIKAQKGTTEFAFEKIKLPKAAWFKINGITVDNKNMTVKVGDVISYPRKKQGVTLEKQKFINKWISDFCKVMGWSIDQYKAFRTQQNTPEQKFSSKSIVNMPKSDFMKMLDQLTAGQRFRVAKMLAYKDEKGNLQPKTKWATLGEYYIQWEKGQEVVAQKLRDASVDGNPEVKEKLMKELKVKSTGMQTIDLLVELFKGQLNDMQVDTTYQSLIEKMDLIANVFPIVDGSGSMDSQFDYKGTRISCRQIAYAMSIAFSTRNPVPEFRNTLGWFSRDFKIIGHSKFIDERPNRFVAKSEFTKQVPNHQVLSETVPFSVNFKSLLQNDPKDVSSTNMFASVEYFVNLVKQGKFHVEDLPQALLYITDNETNTGKSPKEAVILANSIGWQPLLVFWGITTMSHNIQAQLKTVPNALFVGGFNEGALSQILRGIKTGSINPETELWSIFEDKRYSVIQ